VSTKHALLGLLLERPAYGYQLGERLQELLGPAWAINSGQLYQVIKSMEKADLIERIGSDRDETETKRQIFAGTDKGIDEYDEWFEQDASDVRLVRRSLLVKIALAGPDRLEDAVRHIETYERACAKLLGERSRERDAVRLDGMRVRADRFVLRLALGADISSLEAELAWSRHTRDSLSWLQEQNAIWPNQRGRTHITSAGGERERAREELFGRIADDRRDAAPDADASA
jgi:PadR family transcriptional regulator, regulatory protein AphA